METYVSDDVRQFLASFGVATSTGDLEAIAESYAFPALRVTGSTTEVVDGPDAVRDVARAAARARRDHGLVAAAVVVDEAYAVGDELVWARVRWSYRDENANQRESATVRYLLRRARDTFEVCVEVHVAETPDAA